MAGDSRNPKISLLKKYDIPIDHICYEYVEKCADKKELERIVRILRSGEEGFYPDLLKVTEDRLRLFAPDSRVLRVETAILTKESLPKEEWKAVENELLSWEEEMKVVDKTLDFEKSRIDSVGNKNMPSVRKVVEPKAKAVKETKSIRNNTNERIKSGDYAAWDKFDVDKELLKIEIEEERKEEQNQKKKREINKAVAEKKIELDVDKDSYSMMEQEILASQAKDRGNECYKSGDWSNALKYYELSIKLHSTTTAYNNRAMTYIKLKEYENAVNDCNVVLSKEENNVKALHRRATAYQCIEDNSNEYNKLALQDLNKIVLLEPNNKVAQLDLQKLKKKLGIEDVGKKFRMPIFESRPVSNKTGGFAKEDKSLPNLKDAPKNVDKLPLTYYGPSTSTFQCEPYSMAHRALTGSLLSTEVVCKCNSNRARQNPLCQKCGEAISAPKLKVELKKASRNKVNNEAKNMQKIEPVKIDNIKNESTGESITKEVENTKANKQISNEALSGTTCSNVEEIRDRTKEIGTSLGTQIIESKSVEKSEINCVAENKSRLSNSDLGKNAVINSNILSSELEKVDETKAEILEREKPEAAAGLKNDKKINEPHNVSSTACNIDTSKNSELKTCSDSSQTGTKHSSNKTKSKKKKSKESNKESKIRTELELMEPVKVVHAAKYLHPTSVEPKLKTETSKKIEPEVSFVANSQFKAFVPNRQCLSVQREENLSETYLKSLTKKLSVETSNSTIVEKIDKNSSLESNKENFLKSTNTNVSENLNFNGEIKKEMVDSAYKFVKTWEELKKMDPSYAKRAEIIRLIRPADLGKVMGIKLDSDMLSSLLECLEKHFVETDPEVVVDFLKQLPRVPRFGLIKMFLADADKKKMRNLISAAENKGFILEEEVKKALAIVS